MTNGTKVHIPLEEFSPVEWDATAVALTCDVKDFPSVLDSMESYAKKMRADMKPFDQQPSVQDGLVEASRKGR